MFPHQGDVPSLFCVEVLRVRISGLARHGVGYQKQRFRFALTG